MGGTCGVFEGTLVGSRAVLGAGVILTGSVTVYDVVKKTSYKRQGGESLSIPPGAVVVPSARTLLDSVAETRRRRSRTRCAERGSERGEAA